MNCPSWNLLRSLVLICMALLALESSSRAQDDPPVEDDAVVVEPQQFMVNSTYFDTYIFGSNLNAESAKLWLQTRLALHLDELDRACALTDSQKAKLMLAGHGDLKRFFVRVESERERFDKVKTDRVKFSEFLQELAPLKAEFDAGLFGEESIFAKTLKRTLGGEQITRFEASQKEKILFRHHALIDQVVAVLQPSLGLTADQRQRLIQVLRDEVSPLKETKQYDMYYVLYQISKIPEAKLKSAVTDLQWPAIQRVRGQGMAYEVFLQNQGYFPKDRN